jgi:hypothetical protein
MRRIPLAELDALIAGFDGRMPDTAGYHHLSTLYTEHPEAAALRRLDPFSAEYRARDETLPRAARAGGGGLRAGA